MADNGGAFFIQQMSTAGPVGSAINVTPADGGERALMLMAVNPVNGNVLVVWAEVVGSAWVLKGQVFNSSGSPVGRITQLTDPTTQPLNAQLQRYIAHS